MERKETKRSSDSHPSTGAAAISPFLILSPALSPETKRKETPFFCSKAIPHRGPIKR